MLLKVSVREEMGHFAEVLPTDTSRSAVRFGTQLTLWERWVFCHLLTFARRVCNAVLSCNWRHLS